MDIKQIKCTSLELSKQLKEAGYPQKYDDSLWWWCEIQDRQGGEVSGIRLYNWETASNRKYNVPHLNTYVAPTVAELGEVLPEGLYSYKLKLDKNRWYVNYRKVNNDIYEALNVSNESFILFNTEADARAKMWLYLKKEGLIK